jgi:hypothetical protein
MNCSLLAYVYGVADLGLIYQPHLPEMGCRSYHPFNVPDDIYLHRGEEQLSPRKHPHTQVS